MNEGQFGEAGRRIVVEEFLRGSECSVHALVGGGSYRMLATARDHKRAFDGDAGPNTGGMGAVSPADNWSAESEKQFERDVMRPLLGGLAETGIDFRGLLFPGLMMTAEGPRVLEFNCRFGDPETQAILPRLRSDLVELFEATIDGRLDKIEVNWDSRAGCGGGDGLGRLSGKIRDRENDFRFGLVRQIARRPCFSRRDKEGKRSHRHRGRTRSGGDRVGRFRRTGARTRLRGCGADRVRWSALSAGYCPSRASG